MNGEEARRRLRATVKSGGVLIGAGAGTGLSAKCAEAGGADLIIIYNSGRYRMGGRGSPAGLPAFGGGQSPVLGIGGGGRPRGVPTPGFVGVCGTEPLPAAGR